ncbi:MAG TPA: hypothetical protein VGI15_06565, partial [Candidatus Cybelea sp.]
LGCILAQRARRGNDQRLRARVKGTRALEPLRERGAFARTRGADDREAGVEGTFDGGALLLR